MSNPDQIPREALRTLARNVVTQCPDLQQQARSIALQLLARHSLSDDPDQVHWHRFNDQVSSPRAFSGWAHYQKPVQSLTLVELVVERFSAEDSENVDALDAQSGFYRTGADAEYFDERNELPLLPSEALKLFWATNLARRFRSDAQTFWSSHGADYRNLAKAKAIAEAIQAQVHHYLSDTDVNFILTALTGSAKPDANLAMLKATQVPGTALTFLRIGQHQATDILHLLNGERHYLYLPGEADPWVVCQGIEALHWWLLMHCNKADNRARFVRHFTLRSALAEDGNEPLNHTLDLLYSSWGSQDRSLLVPLGKPLLDDPFSALQSRVQSRMLDDAKLKLASNATLSKQIWLNYLGAFSRIFGPMAAADWPIALACVIVDSAEIGVNLDLALDSQQSAQRQANYTAAALACVNLFFDSLALWSTRTPSSVTAPVPTVSTTFTLAEAAPQRLYLTDDLLPEHFKVNKSLEGLSAGVQGDMQGVYLLDGHFYISLDGAVYEVRRSSALNCWRVIDPASPNAFGQHALVHLSEGGEWQLTPQPGLAGGGGALGRLRRVAPVRDYLPPPDGPYAIPADQRKALATYANDPSSEVFDGEDHEIVDDSTVNNALEAFRDKREGLVIDAKAFQLSRPVRTQAKTLERLRATNERQFIHELLSSHAGLILGEVHSQVSAKSFLINNLRTLHKEGVTTLYMEHLLGDFHQQDLAAALREQRIPPHLQQWLNALDSRYHFSGKTRYTYSQLVKLANEEGIRVVPIDNLASYHTAGLEDPDDNLRQSMLNYYAYLRIEQDSVGRDSGKWLALVGDTHASTCRGITGLDELLDVPSIRFEQKYMRSANVVASDTGRTLPAVGSQPESTLKSDYLYQVLTTFTEFPAPDLSKPTGVLPRKSFRITPSDDGWLLTIRLKDDRQTTVRIDDSNWRYRIHVAGLGPVNEHSHESLDGLIADLRRFGFQLVA
ncbi:dermonecrotic toxin domain-containing protein [Pseudomonas putida]|uniref:membrane-targeted effector domain-containing toxin n=1 Tax=Pseudomonas putida TaxID=303 RepID=UPI003839D39F